MILNETPIRTAKNYKINNIELNNVEIPRRISEFESLTIKGNTGNFKISSDISNINLKYGNGQELQILNQKRSNKNINIIAEKSGTLNLDFRFNEEDENLLENIDITLNPKTKNTIVIQYNSAEDLNYFHNGIIKVNAKKDSKSDIVIVNMLNNKSNNFISIENTLEENAKLTYTMVDFGGKNSITNYYSKLQGNNSGNELNTIYLGSKDQIIDLNYIIEAYGEKTTAKINANGAIKDNCKKNFKGTINFKRGCKKAVGDENEYCTILSEKAKSISLPVLLCTEEDVEGNHSTACGKMDKQELFYIMSRGLSYIEAVKLIVKARFNQIIENIKDEKIKEQIINEIDKKIS